MISARAAANAVAASSIAVAALIYRFPPQEYEFYPRCPFYALTHLDCPGCGATRAVAALLHGHWAAALQYNAAVTMLLPVAVFLFARMYVTAMRENRVAWPTVPDWSWRAALATVLIFAVVRDVAHGLF